MRSCKRRRLPSPAGPSEPAREPGLRDLSRGRALWVRPSDHLPNVLSFATFKRFAKIAARTILETIQGPRHLTGFIDP